MQSEALQKDSSTRVILFLYKKKTLFSHKKKEGEREKERQTDRQEEIAGKGNEAKEEEQQRKTKQTRIKNRELKRSHGSEAVYFFGSS